MLRLFHRFALQRNALLDFADCFSPSPLLQGLWLNLQFLGGNDKVEWGGCKNWTFTDDGLPTHPPLEMVNIRMK